MIFLKGWVDGIIYRLLLDFCIKIYRVIGLIYFKIIKKCLNFFLLKNIVYVFKKLFVKF